jgi:ankyrin repeat protein
MSVTIVTAAKEGNYAAVQQCIQEGQDVNMIEDGVTALYNASKYDYLDIVQLLLANNANVNIPRQGTIETPLLIASLNDYNDVCLALFPYTDPEIVAILTEFMNQGANFYSQLYSILTYGIDSVRLPK